MEENIKINETGEVMEKNIIEENINRERNRLEELDTNKWFELNAKLQTKKSIARELLFHKGVLEKKGINDYDNYKYFTEAQYKEIANELLFKAKLEIKAQLKEMYQYTVQGSKTPVGRIARMVYSIIDTETGFYEETYIEGEGLDRGDKAGYKAYTGAVKYFLANTFLVPTGDDPENETPDVSENNAGPVKNSKTTKTTAKKVIQPLATEEQLKRMNELFSTDKEKADILKMAKIEKLEDLTEKLANYFIDFKEKRNQEKKPE